MVFYCVSWRESEVGKRQSKKRETHFTCLPNWSVAVALSPSLFSAAIRLSMSFLFSIPFFHSQQQQQQQKEVKSRYKLEIQRFPDAHWTTVTTQWVFSSSSSSPSNPYTNVVAVVVVAIVKDVGFVKKQVKVSETNRPPSAAIE